MSVSAISGPMIVFGQSPFPGVEYNPDLSPSMFWGGAGILDPRTLFTYLVGEAETQIDYAWLGFDNVTSLSIVPYTKATSAVVASANPTGPSLALVSTSSITTGVYITPSIQRSDTGATDTGVNGAGLVALDAYYQVTGTISNGVLTVTANSGAPLTPGIALISTNGTISLGSVAGVIIQSQLSASGAIGQGYAGTYQLSSATLTALSGTVTFAAQNVSQCAVPFGSIPNPVTGAYGASLGMWNPQSMTARALAVTAAASATYTTATISGYDVYGFPMVEQIALTAGSQVLGKKAWKYIRSVVLSGGTADTTHAYSVDTTDVFGLPIRSDSFADITVNYAAGSLTAVTGITAATGYVASDRTSPATTTTGDVRGTFSGFTSGTAANKLVVRQSPQAQNVSSAVGLFGVTQYANF